MSLNGFTIVKLRDEKLTYIKEWFTKEDISGKESIEVTGVYFVIQPHSMLSLNNMVAFEDEKKTLNVSDIIGMRRIQLYAEEQPQQNTEV